MTVRSDRLWSIAVVLASGARQDITAVASGHRWIVKDFATFFRASTASANLRYVVRDTNNGEVYPIVRHTGVANDVIATSGRFVVIEYGFQLSIINDAALSATFESYGSGADLVVP